MIRRWRRCTGHSPVHLLTHRADTMRCPGHLADCIVNVIGKSLAGLVAAEGGREYLRRHEEGIGFERSGPFTARLARGGMLLGKLHVILRPSRLGPGRRPAINPVRLIQYCL
jgi:hypothetical protein